MVFFFWVGGGGGVVELDVLVVLGGEGMYGFEEVLFGVVVLFGGGGDGG